MDIAVKNTIKQAMKNVKFVHQQYIPKALVTALNKVGAEVATQAKSELAGATGLKAGVVAKKIGKDKARRGDEKYTISIKSKYLNLIEFNGKQTKRGVSAKAWGNRKIYRGAFIGRGQNSGKQLVFKKGRGSKQIRAVHGASLPREFERQDMKKIFNKKIKTRFPILFKRAVEFQMLKALKKI